ncbi:ribonuclease H2, subunit C [Ganoderma leucocontextum]|nr:ribonuclease H2, subunit C [Ganoderma leucocontextum]
MSGTPPALQIASHDLNRPLSSSTPHLMPFHIAYSGPAPISTYFRIKPTSEPTYGRNERPPPTPLPLSESQDSTDSQTTLAAGSSLMPLRPLQGNTTNSSHADSRHFAASFRGRAIHGVEVDLPEGYAGIVLRAPSGDVKNKGAVSRIQTREEERKPKSKGRTTRRSKRAQEPEVVEVEDEGVDSAAPSKEGATRVLQPVSTFSSFVLWHPDIPVDEARDEYLRSLTEWTRLAAEIHRVEDC